jgi:hypothetical protein
MSMIRRSGAEDSVIFSGRSVNGTSVSPWASAGSIHSGRPATVSPASARLLLRISRREGCVVMCVLSAGKIPDLRDALVSFLVPIRTPGSGFPS